MLSHAKATFQILNLNSLPYSVTLFSDNQMFLGLTVLSPSDIYRFPVTTNIRPRIIYLKDNLQKIFDMRNRSSSCSILPQFILMNHLFMVYYIILEMKHRGRQEIFSLILDIISRKDGITQKKDSLRGKTLRSAS
jgi:hypothetical protein